MTKEQKARLDRVRDEYHFEWAKKHARALTYPPTDDALKKVGKKCWDDSWNAAVEHLLPVVEFIINEDWTDNIAANEAIAKVFNDRAEG